MEELLKNNKIVKFNSKSEILKYEYINYVETLVYGGDEMLEINDLPTNEKQVLKTIKFLSNSLSSIKGNSIPQGVKEIYYPWGNETVSINLIGLPISVTTIFNYFINTNEKLTSDKIPNNITSLSFTCYSGFNQTITNGLFNDNITVLNLGDDWNNGGLNISINSLPKSLQEFNIIGYKLNSFNEFPISLTSLSIGHNNNCIINSNDIKLSLPNLKSLSISSILNNGLTITGSNWNELPLQSLKLMTNDIIITENSIYNSKNITNLEIYINLKSVVGYENQLLKKEMIPQNLKSLIMKTQHNKIEKDSLPNTLTSLVYNLQEGIINSLDEIDIFKTLNKLNELSIDFKSNIEIQLPNSIKKLILGSLIQIGNTIHLNKLPQSLLELEFYYSFNELLKIGDLPIGLKKLKLSTLYDKPIEKAVLPNSLEYLEVGSEFNNQIFELPCNLKSLKFQTYGKFNQVFKSSQLPSSLTNLELNNSYSHPLTNDQLPSSLTTLTIPKTILKQSSIPSSVKLLNLN